MNVIGQICPAILGSPVARLQDLILKISCLIGPLINVLIGLGLVFFLWNLAVFILKAGDEEARKNAKKMMFWGILAIFIMVSIWGIIKILQGEFGIEAVSF
ncbi:MAG TPA: hypothetical protein VJC12_02135 [Candidatus Paceibacterota bacterium]